MNIEEELTNFNELVGTIKAFSDRLHELSEQMNADNDTLKQLKQIRPDQASMNVQFYHVSGWGKVDFSKHSENDRNAQMEMRDLMARLVIERMERTKTYIENISKKLSDFNSKGEANG